MFRITIVTDDKKLPKLLRAFKGLILGAPEVYPLEGAEEVDGKLREVPVDSETPLNGRDPPWVSGKKPGRTTKAPGETLPDQVALKLIKQKPAVINAEVLRRVTVEAGSTADSYAYVVKFLRKLGILTGPTTAGLYAINEDAYHRRIEGGQ